MKTKEKKFFIFKGIGLVLVIVSLFYISITKEDISVVEKNTIING